MFLFKLTLIIDKTHKMKKMLKVKDIFGKLKFGKSTEELLEEVDEELDSKFLKD